MRLRRFSNLTCFILCALFVAGCGGSGGGTRVPMPDTAQRVVFDDSGALAGQYDLIRMLIEDTINLASTELPVENIVVTVRDDTARTVPGYGLAGFALGPQSVEIVIDPQFQDSTLIARLPHLVAHELHHKDQILQQSVG
ncbi:MAG: hypothetical protein AAFO81_12060 [Pseudomonadota bacterium]